MKGTSKDYGPHQPSITPTQSHHRSTGEGGRSIHEHKNGSVACETSMIPLVCMSAGCPGTIAALHDEAFASPGLTASATRRFRPFSSGFSSKTAAAHLSKEAFEPFALLGLDLGPLLLAHQVPHQGGYPPQLRKHLQIRLGLNLNSPCAFPAGWS